MRIAHLHLFGGYLTNFVFVSTFCCLYIDWVLGSIGETIYNLSSNALSYVSFLKSHISRDTIIMSPMHTISTWFTFHAAKTIGNGIMRRMNWIKVFIIHQKTKLCNRTDILNIIFAPLLISAQNRRTWRSNNMLLALWPDAENWNFDEISHRTVSESGSKHFDKSREWHKNLATSYLNRVSRSMSFKAFLEACRRRFSL